MIVFRYSKTGGAEFISHLDTLRHLNKTFVRAEMPVKASQGFHPHLLVYMSSPIGVGQTSYAEYCTVDVDMPTDEFVRAFNEFSPRGLRCISAVRVEKNPNLASIIGRAKYEITGINKFEVTEILSLESFTVTDKRGREKQVREKIYKLWFEGDTLYAELAAGNDCLRADVLADKLKELYGTCGNVCVCKLESYLSNGEDVESIL